MLHNHRHEDNTRGKQFHWLHFDSHFEFWHTDNRDQRRARVRNMRAGIQNTLPLKRTCSQSHWTELRPQTRTFSNKIFKMVARSFPNHEFSYSRLLQVPDDDDNEFFTIQELNPSTSGVQQTLVHHYQPTYYELPNMLDTSCSSSTLQFHSSQSVSMSSASGNVMEAQQIDGSPMTSGRKRKASFTETSDADEEEGRGDDKSVKTNDEIKKQNHSEIEKRRRDKMNTYITELSSMVPMCHAMSRKLDKLTVLRMAVQHIKSIKGAVNSYTEGHYKPSFLTDEEMKHLILQAADGFLFVVGCDRGRILYVSESVSKILNYTQGELLGQSLFDILHPKDVAKVKEQLSSSDLNPRERLIDAKTMLPVKTDVPQSVTKLCPGARRSFFCRMKSKMTLSQIKEEADTTTGFHRRKKHNNPDKKFNVIHCTGYLKSWAPAKIGLDDQEAEGDSDPCNLSCLAAVGRILPPVSVTSIATHGRPEVAPIQFISRHTLDGKFLYVDQTVTLILGFLPQELLGTSMYEYYHRDDVQVVSEYHKCALQSAEQVTTKPYRFRAKDKGYVRLQTGWKSFKNPWTKEIEYLIGKNCMVLNVVSTASCEEEMQDNFDFFTQSSGKDMQRMINTHIEASKIGRQIAEQVMDLHRQGVESLSNSPNPDPESSLIAPSESHISTSADQLPPNLLDDGQQQQNYNIGTSIPLVNDPGGPIEDNVMEMMDDTIRDLPSQGVRTDGNDEAAMAVIMSLLEADAGLGGPVDFSGLPWPLP